MALVRSQGVDLVVMRDHFPALHHGDGFDLNVGRKGVEVFLAAIMLMDQSDELRFIHRRRDVDLFGEGVHFLGMVVLLLLVLLLLVVLLLLLVRGRRREMRGSTGAEAVVVVQRHDRGDGMKLTGIRR